MKLVVGLGNPGAEYENSRHNVGFRVLDKLAAKLGWQWNERRARAIISSGTLGAEKVLLAKPITYMNNSGESVGELMRWYKLQPEDLLVVYDEMDLPVGRLRLRGDGSAAGHNGIDNIIRHLHTNRFPRLRVGVGHPTNTNMPNISHVLGVPPMDERIQLETGEERAAEFIPQILTQGVATTMNLVNTDPEEQKKAEERRRLQQEKRAQEKLRKEQAQQEEQSAQPGQ